MTCKRVLMSVFTGAVFVAICSAQATGLAGSPVSSDTWRSKLSFHFDSAYGPEPLIGSAAFAGFLQAIDSPREWGQGSTGYGKRFVSTMAFTGIRNALAFGLDTTLHQDPHYYRSGRTGAWRRMKYVLHATLYSRTDSGGETLATWRIGSAYSAAFIANQWRPDRINNVTQSFREGSTQLGFDLLGNFGTEFWPDARKKLLHR